MEEEPKPGHAAPTADAAPQPAAAHPAAAPQGTQPAAAPQGAPSPALSIIVPVYNAAGNLPRCIESALAQELRDFELILVDDGSTDESPAICDAYADRDPRVRVIHQRNAGVSAARNRALDEARGTCVQFMDADDWMAPNAAKLMMRALTAHDCDMVIADYYRVVGTRTSRKGDIDLDRPITPAEYADCMIENPADYYYGALWNKLFRRDLIERHRLRMDPALSWCEDFIFNMEYVAHAARIYPLHVPVYYYVKTEGSLVDQSMTIASIVRMKLGVIEYYDDFFRRVYDEAEYTRRHGEIRRFLIEYPHDGGAFPAAPSTKKLGHERMRAYVTPGTERNPRAGAYFAGKVLDRALEAVADRFDLELRDVQVIAYVHHAGGAAGFAETADFTGLSSVALGSALSKLAGRQLLRANASGSVFLKRLAADRERQGTFAAALAALGERLDEAGADEPEDEKRGLAQTLAAALAEAGAGIGKRAGRGAGEKDGAAGFGEAAANNAAAGEKDGAEAGRGAAGGGSEAMGAAAPRDGAAPSLVRIRLTERAAPVTQAIERAEQDARDICLEGLAPAEREQLMGLLARVTANAKAPFAR